MFECQQCLVIARKGVEGLTLRRPGGRKRWIKGNRFLIAYGRLWGCKSMHIGALHYFQRDVKGCASGERGLHCA